MLGLLLLASLCSSGFELGYRVGKSLALGVKAHLTLRPKCRIEFSRGNVIQIVAHRLESDAHQNLEYLLLTVSCGEEVLDRLRFHMSTLGDDLLRENHK